MEEIRYTAEDLVNIVNERLNSENITYTDSRLSKKLTTRRFRDYIHKGLVSPPKRDGKNIYFTKNHVKETYYVRSLSLNGYSDYVIKSKKGLRKYKKDFSNNEEDSVSEVIRKMRDRKDSNSNNNDGYDTRALFNSGSSNLQKNIKHYITSDGNTYLKVDINDLKEIDEDNLDKNIDNCNIKIDLTKF